LTAAVSETTTHWADGFAGVDVWAGAAWAVPVAVARVVATANTAKRRGFELMLVGREPACFAEVDGVFEKYSLRASDDSFGREGPLGLTR
jgi:hypothetical protein